VRGEISREAIPRKKTSRDFINEWKTTHDALTCEMLGAAPRCGASLGLRKASWAQTKEEVAIMSRDNNRKREIIEKRIFFLIFSVSRMKGFG
jgi:hypothetical protein